MNAKINSIERALYNGDDNLLVDVCEGIEKLVVRFAGGMQEVNSYLVKGENGYTVIDTGIYAEEAIATWEALFDTGVEVEKVVLTHTHQDHIGLARWFQEQKGVPVFISKLGYKEMLKHRDKARIKGNLADLLHMHGGPDLPSKIGNDSFIYEFEPDGFFDETDTMLLGNQLFEVVWTPGHAPDHYCFYQKDRKLMLIGDHILNRISPVIGLWTGEEFNPLNDYFASVERMQHYPTELALPGHGGNIHHLGERVQTLLQGHEHRLEEVESMVKAESLTANEVCGKIYGSLHFSLFISPFMATLTRLIYLESMDKVYRFHQNGKVYFRFNQ